jgi:hypothetical protein
MPVVLRSAAFFNGPLRQIRSYLQGDAIARCSQGAAYLESRRGQAVKRLLKVCWNGVSPAIRPFVRRVDAHLDSHIGRLAEQMSAWHAQQVQSVRDFELLAESLVREVVRLQAQIVLLEENLHAALGSVQEEGGSPALRPTKSQAA